MVENIGNQPQEDFGKVGREHRQTGYLFLTRKANEGIKIQPDIDIDVRQVNGSTVILDIVYLGEKDSNEASGLVFIEEDERLVLNCEGKTQIKILNRGKHGIGCIKLGIHAPGRQIVRKELLEREIEEARDLTNAEQ